MHPDVVSASRLFLMPAAVTTLAVVFTREFPIIPKSPSGRLTEPASSPSSPTGNHNLIAEKLLAINEGGRFTAKAPRKPQVMYDATYPQDHPDVTAYKKLVEADPHGLKQQDEDLFQTARLVNCGWFL